MSSYFDQLRQDLRLATQRHHRSRARIGPLIRLVGSPPGGWLRRRSVPRRWPAILCIATALGAASAAAAGVDLFGGAHRLEGRVPSAALTEPAAAIRVLGAEGAPVLPKGLRYAVPITPDIEPGDAGWCGAPVYTPPGADTPLTGGASACATAVEGGYAVVAGGEPLTNLQGGVSSARPDNGAERDRTQLKHTLQRWLRGRQEAAQLNWFVYSAPVAAVKIGTTTYPTFSSPDLPAGWRALVLFTRGALPPSPVALDDRGRPLAEPAAHRGEEVQHLLQAIPIQHVAPARLPSAPCGLGSARRSGLMRSAIPSSAWEVLAARLPTLGSRVQPGTLFSCARAWYAFSRPHVVYSAALLLNAQSPVRPAPPLPGLATTSTPGVYEMDAATGGRLSARRAGNAWLVVEGPSPGVRHRLLAGIAIRGGSVQG